MKLLNADEKNPWFIQKWTIQTVADACYCRFLAKSILGVNDPDYYEWETHIFFDDAFEPDDSGKEFVVNQFVRLLVDKVDEQGKNWYGKVSSFSSS